MLKMPEKIVINTGPIIALIAALDELEILKILYSKVIVPQEVCQEILAKEKERYDAKIFKQNTWIDKQKNQVFLEKSLDCKEVNNFIS